MPWVKSVAASMLREAVSECEPCKLLPDIAAMELHSCLIMRQWHHGLIAALGMREADEIEVTAKVDFLEQPSCQEENQYVFGYKITITNHGDQAVTLMRRRWVITGDEGAVQIVSGEGVVGETPRIAPGESYAYGSFSVISSPVGSMHGHYECELADGERVTVKIPPFGLAVPGILH